MTKRQPDLFTPEPEAQPDPPARQPWFRSLRTMREILRPTLEQALALADYRMTSGAYAGKTLEEIARTERGLRMLRFVSRGTIPTPELDAIRAYLSTINPNYPELPDSSNPYPTSPTV